MITTVNEGGDHGEPDKFSVTSGRTLTYNCGWTPGNPTSLVSHANRPHQRDTDFQGYSLSTSHETKYGNGNLTPDCKESCGPSDPDQLPDLVEKSVLIFVGATLSPPPKIIQIVRAGAK